MRPTLRHKSTAFTRIELIVVVVVVFFVLAVLILPVVRDQEVKSPRISCLNNLKQIGTAYRIWSNDHGERYSASQSANKGGWSDFLANADQGYLCWTNYAIMANELGRSPHVLACPSDERKPSETFAKFGNTNLSYFVGVSAELSQPESLLGGDRNLGGGTKPDPEYGFSPEIGRGNDVAIQTNSQAGPVCWSLKMHSPGNTNGGGNLLLGDGSAQEVNTFSFRSNWQPFFGQTTNWPAGHAPSSPSIRVLFP
jgi:competence protein ComGC